MVTVTLLGTAQDGGRPQPGCTRPCCQGLCLDDRRFPVALGITDEHGRGHLMEATRALGEQLTLWDHPEVSSVILTHAHFGHVDGLGLFGRETLNARDLNLYASASMQSLVTATPAWALLLEQGVFTPVVVESGRSVSLSEGVTLEAVEVPHRAELSDMHAFVIRGPHRSLLFLPDHDRWSETLAFHDCSTIRAWLARLHIDVALIDGTFWSDDELSGRVQNDVPHPAVQETLARLGLRQPNDPEVVFIHLNHTNPLHRPASLEHQQVVEQGWVVGRQGMTFTL